MSLNVYFNLTWITASSELKLNLIWFSSSSWMLRGRWDGMSLQQKVLFNFLSNTVYCFCKEAEIIDIARLLKRSPNIFLTASLKHVWFLIYSRLFS